MDYSSKINELSLKKLALEEEISFYLKQWAAAEIRDRVASAVLRDRIPLKKIIDKFKKDLIVHTIEICGGNRHAAARVLRISRSGMILLCSKYLEGEK